nr:protein jagged 2 [Hymenolepis microstoma]
MNSLVILLLTFSCRPILAHAEEAIGELKFSFFFDSIDGRLPNGQTCDPWPNQNCDIYLKICVKSPGVESCDMFDKQTSLWANAHFGQTTVTFPLKFPIPTWLEVIVEAWDYDSGTSTDLIAHFRGKLIVAETPNTATIFEMKRDDVSYVNNFRLDSYVHIVCSPFHYGGDCSRKCIPDRERYACDVNGFKRCRQGFFGEECDQRDYCLNHNCSDFAECKNTPTGFDCWCEGSTGPQCQMGYNPCAEEHASCSGHGACSRAGKYNISFECSCDVGWEGKRCQVRRPPCVVANENNWTICLNGGHCKDLNAERGAYICECAPGWWGQHCEKKTAIIYKMVFAAIIYVAIGLITFTTIISCIIFFCKRKGKPIKPTFTYMTGSQLSQVQPELRSLSFSNMKGGEPYAIVPQVSSIYSLPPELPLQSPATTAISLSNPDRYAVAAFV